MSGGVAIVPGVDPAKGGVAAYAVELARRLPGGIGEFAFLTPASVEKIPDDLRPESVRVVSREGLRFAAEIGATNKQRVLLHYVGFGYAPDACPQWVLDGLTRWKTKTSGGVLHVFFHELATEEPWWRRTAWSQPRQRRIIGGIAHLADRVATNCPHFLTQLRGTYGVTENRARMVPVPPTLAERNVQAGCVPSRDRALTALIFGLAGTRQQTINAHRQLLRKMAQTGALARVILAGHNAAAHEADSLGVPSLQVEAKPDLGVEELEDIARQADFGLIWNWASILTKSTVFANLCAFGLPTIIGQKGSDTRTGLTIEFAALGCDGSGESIARTAAAIADPSTRTKLQTNALRLAETTLSWPSVAEALSRHFVP